MNQKIVIAGGKGFIGKALERHFTEKGNVVSILTRNPTKSNHVYWNGQSLGPWMDCLESSDVLINLCGKSVDCRYTTKNKKAILKSRTTTTELLGKALSLLNDPPSTWLNASSATIYIESKEQLMTEEDGIVGDDFSMRVCKEWEEALNKLSMPKIRKVSLRLSIVLGKNCGAFPKYRQITNLGLGGYQGTGKQMMSWIHIEDVCRAITFIISDHSIQGPINITSPNPIENNMFMTYLRSCIGITFGLPQPKILLELGAFFLRTETELLLKSRNVYPEKLLKAGFKFKFSNIEYAVQHLLGDSAQNKIEVERGKKLA